MAEPFATRAQAMDFIADALPKATRQNPEYLTKADGTLARWLTESVGFSSGAGVIMRERFTQTRDGKTTEGRHEAAFSLSEATVADFSAPGDVTPAGEPARGVLFTCAKPGCVAARWDDASSRADKTDVYIQDPAIRAKLVAAFRRLQTP